MDDQKPVGIEVVSPQAAYIITDILAGNTIKNVNPYWGKLAVSGDGKRRPAAYKTGTTNDNRDVHAYGFLAPPRTRRGRPSRSASGWATATTSRTRAACRSTRPRRSGRRSSRRSARAVEHLDLQVAGRPREGDRGCVHRPQARAVHDQDRRRVVHQGHGPLGARRSASSLEIDAASGLRWQDGCVGPRTSRGFFDLTEVESNFPAWQKANRQWAARAAKGTGVRGGPEGTRTSYFYNGSFAPFGRSWGAPFAPARASARSPPADATTVVRPGIARSVPAAGTARTPGPKETKPPKPVPERLTASEARRQKRDDRRPVAALAALPGPDGTHERVPVRRRAGRHRAARRSRGRG